MKRYITALLLLLLHNTAASAQNVNLTRVEISEPCTPAYQNEDGLDSIQVNGLIQTSPSGKKWFRISAEYSTGVDWLDQLTLEYYVLFPGETNVFRGVTSYVDIPRGRQHLSEMYLHFNSYERHYRKGLIQYAVIALINGKQVAKETNKNNPDEWWKKLPAYPHGLLNRNQTPFAVINIEKFNAHN